MGFDALETFNGNKILANVFYCKFLGPKFWVYFTLKQAIFNYYRKIKCQPEGPFRDIQPIYMQSDICVCFHGRRYGRAVSGTA
jgi:hypothetical protein